MKIYALLLVGSLCIASDPSTQDSYAGVPKKDNVIVTNTITITTPPPVIKRLRPAQAGPKHPDVVAAHEQLRRIKEEEDAVTCCCFFKIKKKI